MNERLKLHFEMLRIRRIEEKIASEYSKQEMRCPVHLSIGQEAVAVGVCQNLRQGDIVFGTHRSHAQYLAKGGDLRRMICELFGRANGCSKGRGGSMHLVDLNAGFSGSVPIVGSIIPIATGAAFSNQLERQDTGTTVFFGEAASEQGAF